MWLRRLELACQACQAVFLLESPQMGLDRSARIALPDNLLQY
jgi:DNA-binding transcriptional regulator/RsmH inhibitor MraZ